MSKKRKKVKRKSFVVRHLPGTPPALGAVDWAQVEQQFRLICESKEWSSDWRNETIVIESALVANTQAGKTLYHEAASEYMRFYESVLAARLDLVSGALSAAEWLWYLRRVPRFIFEGSVSTTAGYVRMLAEAAGGGSATPASLQMPSPGASFELPITKKRMHDLLKLILLAKELHGAHALARLCGKGAGILTTTSRPCLIGAEPIQRFVEVYDRRMALHGETLFGALGTAPPSLSERSLTDSDIGLTLFHELQEPTEQECSWPTDGRKMVIRQRFGASSIPLSHLADLLPNLEAASDPRTMRELVAVLAILSLCTKACATSPPSLFNLVERGYLLKSLDQLKAELDAALPVALQAFESLSIPIEAPEDSDAVLQTLGSWQHRSFPIFPASPVRRAGQVVIIDAYGATFSLRRLLTYSRVTGEVANVRGRHFESKLQRLIDDTPARPIGCARALIGKTIVRDGKPFTNIDAVAVRGSQIILIDAKSKRYDDEIEGGEWRVVNTLMRFLEGSQVEWQRKISIVVNERLSDVVDEYSIVEGVVCTPFVPYLTDEVAIAKMSSGLRPIVSAGELEAWCRETC